MLSVSAETLKERIEKLKESVSAKAGDSIIMEIIEGESVIGGGSAPDVKPKTWLLSLTKTSVKPEAIEQALRDFETPVIARIVDDRVVIDLRTVFADEEETLIDAIAGLR
jgi:L-seryl-tRNA(Ser) seleniumtransferase